MRLKLRAFGKREDGGVLIEFAFVLPVFLLLIMGILEFGIVFYLRGAVEESTRSVARLGITGSTYDAASGVSRTTYLDTTLRSRLEAVVFNPENLRISSRVQSSYNAPVGTTSNSPVTNFGGSGQLVEYTVEYDHEYLTPLGSLANGLNSTLTIISTAFAQNETF